MASKMKMQTRDPLMARQWFQLRGVVNWAITIAVFVTLVFLLQNICPAFIGDCIAVVIVFILFFYVLDKRAIGIKCPNCEKHVESNTPWICGVCGAVNLHTDNYPFIGRCEKCHAKPKAYQCHHRGCGNLIFFTKDRQEINFAKCVNMPGEFDPKLVKKYEEAEKIEKLDTDIQLTRRMLKKAELDVVLKGLNESLAPPPKQKTAFEDLEEYYKSMVGNEDAAKKWHAAIDAEFPTDPVEREKRHEVVNQWMRNKS